MTWRHHIAWPGAERWDPRFGPGDFLRQLQQRGAREAPLPLSIYVHLPFCIAGCRFCACEHAVEADPAASSRYLAYLEREIMTQRGALDRDEEVAAIRLGGGTPNFLGIGELSRLMECLRRHFVLLPGGDWGIELDPRGVAPQLVEQLAVLGFNRLSLGVQDFEPAVQVLVGRVQSVEETARVLASGRASGFRSVALDIVCGLPGQDEASIARTLRRVAELRPDRVALRRYEHDPASHPAQRALDPATVPGAGQRERLRLFAAARLLEAGFEPAGLDRFVLGDREAPVLAEADVLAFGPSAISCVGGAVAQNHPALDPYYGSLDRGELPVHRGHVPDADDLLRRHVMGRLAAGARLDFDEIATRFNVAFESYFRPERPALETLAREGVVELSRQGLVLTRTGHLHARRVCAVFDPRTRVPA